MFVLKLVVVTLLSIHSLTTDWACTSETNPAQDWSNDWTKDATRDEEDHTLGDIEACLAGMRLDPVFEIHWKLGEVDLVEALHCKVESLGEHLEGDIEVEHLDSKFCVN